MKIGSLCSGYGGLEMGVQAVYGGTVAWVSDIDKGACKILAHRHPDLPNLGDFTVTDWSTVEPVDIITAGFPCQPVSNAGKRLGDEDERWLWDDVLRAVREVRPGVVVLENVRGLLTARSGVLFGRVLGSLADIGYDASWHGIKAADVGAPHNRFRVFIVATDTDRSGCGSVGRLESVGRDTDGRGGADGPGSAAEPMARRLLKTPTSQLAVNGGSQHPDKRRAGGHGPTLADEIEHLLPTPAVNDMGAGKTVEAWDEWTADMQARHGNGNGHGKSLAIGAQRLLPTPERSDGTGGRKSSELGGFRESGAKRAITLATAVDHAQWGDYAAAITRWEHALGRPAPEPTTRDWERWGKRKARRLASRLPVGMRGSIDFIVRGPAPQLSPAFVEWMMGLPAGWVTDVPGITRNEALRALGNGVCPQQAVEALRVMAGWEAVA